MPTPMSASTPTGAPTTALAPTFAPGSAPTTSPGQASSGKPTVAPAASAEGGSSSGGPAEPVEPTASATDGIGIGASTEAKRGGSGPVVSGLSKHEGSGGATTQGVAAGVLPNLFGGGSASFEQLVTEFAPTIATASAGAAAWAAFAFFGKRRRDDDEPSDQLLAVAAGSVYEAGAAPGLRVVDESLLPRWRRPSLQQVRRTDPMRATAEAQHLSFASAGVRPLENHERRQIGYRLVRLLDSPDELRSAEIGILDQGDEVQLLQRSGAYWLVLCPDGGQGWVHRMTLTECDQAAVVEVEPTPVSKGRIYDGTPDNVQPAEEPSTGGLLEAYLKARGDVLRTLKANPAETSWEFVTAPQPDASAAPQPDASSAPLTDVVTSFSAEERSPGAAPASGSARAGERYSERRNAGSRKAATASRPGTRSRRPSR